MNKSKSKSWQPAVFLFLKMSGWIAFPVIVSLLLGKWLDQRFDTKPVFFLSLTGVAFMISIFGIVRESKKTMNFLEKQSSDKDVSKDD
jgi:F0F1-type ATP synthase assembly protein I